MYSDNYYYYYYFVCVCVCFISFGKKKGKNTLNLFLKNHLILKINSQRIILVKNLSNICLKVNIYFIL